jgi:exonuclease III
MKKLMKGLLYLIITIIVIVAAYVLYVILTFYRIDDNTQLLVENNQKSIVEINQEYTLMTYNVGFGAYQQDYSFFMDCGTLKTGEEVCGAYGKGISEEDVLNNIETSINIASTHNLDFYFFQEVDKKSDRAFDINQYDLVTKEFNEYSSVYGQNFHSSFLAYPLHDMHGASDAGLVSLSKYQIDESTRRTYSIPEGFPAKYMDLDRCFMVDRYNLENGKQLVLINSHMSAYDEGGTTRKKQLAELNAVMKEEFEKGNYVIVGGDFNHDIADSTDTFLSEEKTPTWIYDITDDDLTEGYSIVVADNSLQVATCRAAELPYVKGVNHVDIIDGFFVSKNITASSVNVETEYISSDHNPVILTFTLN